MTDLSFIEKKPIQKGWSCDSKYCVTAADGTKYLMRITPHEKSASRENMFRMQQKVAELGVPCADRLLSVPVMRAFITYRPGLTDRMRKKSFPTRPPKSSIPMDGKTEAYSKQFI